MTGTAVSETPLKTIFFPGVSGRYSTAGLPVSCELIVEKSAQKEPVMAEASSDSIEAEDVRELDKD